MKCPNCGKNIKEESTSYCPYCGQPLDVKESLATITRLKIEHDEAKSSSKEWGTASWILMLAALVCAILIPFPLDIFVIAPLFILSVTSQIVSYHYRNKAKKIKDRL